MNCSDDLTIEELVKVADVLRLLAHPYRLRIVELLQSGPEPVHVLVEQLNIAQATVSRHLNAMRRLGLVAAERRGKEVWYRIKDPRCLAILRCIREKVDADAGRVAKPPKRKKVARRGA